MKHFCGKDTDLTKICEECRKEENPEADRVYKMYEKELEYFKKRLKTVQKKADDKLQETIEFYEKELKKGKN